MVYMLVLILLKEINNSDLFTMDYLEEIVKKFEINYEKIKVKVWIY